VERSRSFGHWKHNIVIQSILFLSLAYFRCFSLSLIMSPYYTSCNVYFLRRGKLRVTERNHTSGHEHVTKAQSTGLSKELSNSNSQLQPQGVSLFYQGANTYTVVFKTATSVVFDFFFVISHRLIRFGSLRRRIFYKSS